MENQSICQNLNINFFDIHKNIFKIVKESGGLINLYKKTRMINKKLIIIDNEMEIKYVNIFEFMSVYRKVLIQTIFDSYIKELIKMKDYEIFYKNVPSQFKKLNVNLYSTGSNNLFSDYDVQIYGPGNYLLFECIYKIMLKFLKNTDSDRKISVHEYFNSNFYLTPHMIINEYNHKKIENIIGNNKIIN